MGRFSRTPELVFLAALMALNPVHAQQELPLTGPAYVITEEAYQAFEKGDFDRAIERAREAARLRPDVARIKVLLDKALAAKQIAQQPGHAQPSLPMPHAQQEKDNGYRDAADAYRSY